MAPQADCDAVSANNKHGVCWDHMQYCKRNPRPLLPPPKKNKAAPDCTFRQIDLTTEKIRMNILKIEFKETVYYYCYLLSMDRTNSVLVIVKPADRR